MMNIYAKTFMIAARADKADAPRPRPAPTARPPRRWIPRLSRKSPPRGF